MQRRAKMQGALGYKNHCSTVPTFPSKLVYTRRGTRVPMRAVLAMLMCVTGWEGVPLRVSTHLSFAHATNYILASCSCSLLEVTQARGHVACSCPPPRTTTVCVLHTYRRKGSSFSSLVDARRICACTHAIPDRRFLQADFFPQETKKKALLVGLELTQST